MPRRTDRPRADAMAKKPKVTQEQIDAMLDEIELVGREIEEQKRRKTPGTIWE